MSFYVVPVYHSGHNFSNCILRRILSANKKKLQKIVVKIEKKKYEDSLPLIREDDTLLFSTFVSDVFWMISVSQSLSVFQRKKIKIYSLSQIINNKTINKASKNS